MLRCTRIGSVNGVEVLVPNSMLPAKDVINWTLPDAQHQASIRFGAIYGPAASEVAEPIRQVADKSRAVLQSPEPSLLFDDLSDNALIFEVFFWTKVKTMTDLTTTCSDIRFRIDGLFREAGQIIAFPQRDVHPDALRPIEVRVTPGAPGAGSPSEGCGEAASPLEFGHRDENEDDKRNLSADITE